MTVARIKRTRRVPGRRDQILDVAEKLARHGGYHGFSFRDIAAEVGVKSASVHYHFPTKSDLTVALTERYAEAFILGLGDPGDPGAPRRLIAAFRDALVVDDRMCLCGLFASEIDTLPMDLKTAVATFFARTVEWTAAALGDPADDRSGAETLVAGLEGAMIVARAVRDPAMYERISEKLLAAVKRHPCQSSIQ